MEERVSKLEAEVVNIDKRLCKNEKRLDIHGKEIDEINKDFGTLEKDRALLNLTVEHVLANTKEIKVDLEELRKLREDDHYIKPLVRNEKLKSQMIGVIIGILVAAFLSFLFPQIR